MSVTKPTGNNRWYIVADKKDNARCLVEANAPGQALRRAAEQYCNVRAASVAETIDMIRRGCDVISAPQSPEQMEIEDEIAKADVPGLMPQPTGKEDGTPEEAELPGTSETGQLIRQTTRRAAEVFGALREQQDGDDPDAV